MNKKELYASINEQLEGLIGQISYGMANLANASALLFECLEDLNWAGFYLMRDGQLVLGPVQGKTACILIPVGRGVCGTAVLQDAAQVVQNVHEFPGHIACDGASRSEIVIPIHMDGKVWGVLDIDSPSYSRFDQEDLNGLLKFVEILEKKGNITSL